MRQNRRQELRTNEFSEQLEQMTAYARRNAAALAVTVIAAAAIIGGVWYYLHQRNARLMEGWTTLSSAAERTEPGGSPVAAYESVAQANLAPGLTAEALLMVGKAALEKFERLDAPPSTQPAPAADVEPDWAAKAEWAYGEVLTRFPENITAVGAAMVLTGVVCEDRHDVAKAREWYQKVVDDPRFSHTPFRQQASYRLAHLDHWMTPVVFPPPLQTVPEPPPTAAPAAEAPPQPAIGQPVALQPTASPPVVVPPAATPPSPATPAPIPGGGTPEATPPGGVPSQPPGNAPVQPTGNAPAPPPSAAPASPTGNVPVQPTSAPVGG